MNDKADIVRKLFIPDKLAVSAIINIFSVEVYFSFQKPLVIGAPIVQPVRDTWSVTWWHASNNCILFNIA